MKNISREDYIIWNIHNDEPVEGLSVVYHYSTLVELFNEGMVLELNKEELRCVAELPLKWQKEISEAIEKTK